MEAYELLEERFALWQGLKPANMVACSSGTAALHLALECLCLDKSAKNKIIIPDYTMVACARAATLAELDPVFVGCDPDTLLIDLNGLYKALNRSVGVIMVVHVYGRRVDMDHVHTAVVHGNNCLAAVVEDLAEAHGVRPHPYTDAACWSFYKNKIVAGEEGGAVYFRDPDKAALARQLRTLGFTPAHDYRHLPRGHNYRLANCLAEKVLASLGEYPKNLAYRRMLELQYEKHCPKRWRMPFRDAPWVYDIRIPRLEPSTQQEIVGQLRRDGIAARFGFHSMCDQEEYKTSPRVGVSESLRASCEVIYLPLTPGTPEAVAVRSFELIREVLGERN